MQLLPGERRAGVQLVSRHRQANLLEPPLCPLCCAHQPFGLPLPSVCCRCHDHWRHALLQQRRLHTLPCVSRHGEKGPCGLLPPPMGEQARHTHALAHCTSWLRPLLQGACQCPNCRGTGKRASWLTPSG